MKFIKKFKCAGSGLIIGLKQPSILLQLFLGLATVSVFMVLNISLSDWLIVIFAIAMVVLAEWINSIAELMVDYISLAVNPQAKLIKDFSAGLVLLAAGFAVVIGVLLLIKYLG